VNLRGDGSGDEVAIKVDESTDTWNGYLNPYKESIANATDNSYGNNYIDVSFTTGSGFINSSYTGFEFIFTSFKRKS